MSSLDVSFKLVERAQRITLFTVTFSHLHDNVFERGREAISGNSAVFARNCLTSTLKYIVTQMRKGNREKGCWEWHNLHGEQGCKRDNGWVGEGGGRHHFLYTLYPSIRFLPHIIGSLLFAFFPKC